MKVITAPEEYTREPGDIFCFLAGGITNCPDWQKEVIKYLEKTGFKHLVIFNPRREVFPIDDPNAAREQIEWEFKYLEQADIFSMYFCAGESDQPICMYELGRNAALMNQKYYPEYIEGHMAIGVEKGYKREKDVIIQTELALKNDRIVNTSVTPVSHAASIAVCYMACYRDMWREDYEQ